MSFARQVADQEYEYYVLEISSFQLDGMFEFKAETAVLLNITPDHLDRYDHRFENYAASKFRIMRNQDKTDIFIYNADDTVITNEMKKLALPAQQIPFSLGNFCPGEGPG